MGDSVGPGRPRGLRQVRRRDGGVGWGGEERLWGDGMHAVGGGEWGGGRDESAVGVELGRGNQQVSVVLGALRPAREVVRQGMVVIGNDLVGAKREMLRTRERFERFDRGARRAHVLHLGESPPVGLDGGGVQQLGQLRRRRLRRGARDERLRIVDEDARRISLRIAQNASTARSGRFGGDSLGAHLAGFREERVTVDAAAARCPLGPRVPPAE